MSKTATWKIGLILTGSVAAGCLAALASGAEAPAGPPPKRPGFVARLDKNGDGKVSAAEFDGPADAFKAMDKNHDGFLSEAEAPKGPPPRRRPTRAEDQARFIARLDQDGDGKVSAEEFDGPPEHFEEADANNDGYIETAEVPPPPPPCAPPGGKN
jgi:hypothetical protein